MGERGCLKITKFEYTYFMDGLLGYSKKKTHTLKKNSSVYKKYEYRNSEAAVQSCP